MEQRKVSKYKMSCHKLLLCGVLNLESLFNPAEIPDKTANVSSPCYDIDLLHYA